MTLHTYQTKKVKWEIITAVTKSKTQIVNVNTKQKTRTKATVAKYTVKVSTENTITTPTTDMMSLKCQPVLTNTSRERKVN